MTRDDKIGVVLTIGNFTIAAAALVLAAVCAACGFWALFGLNLVVSVWMSCLGFVMWAELRPVLRSIRQL